MRTLLKIACGISLASFIVMASNVYANSHIQNTSPSQQNMQLAYMNYYNNYAPLNGYYNHDSWGNNNKQLGGQAAHWDSNGRLIRYDNINIPCPMVQVCDYTGYCYWVKQC